MVVFNYSGKEVSAKIVYYGPGLSGKTTNLEQIYGKVPDTQRGKMVSMKTKTDRTLFFDFLPLSAGEINGFRTRFLLYTVPGQVYYNATRKLVLKGSDGVVFVADSDPELRDANLESFANLEKNLAEYGMDLQTLPIVLQYNKRDVPNAMSIEALDRDLNRGNWPHVEAIAIRGQGVFETFKEITRLVFKKMNERVDRRAMKSDLANEESAGSPLSSAPLGGTGGGRNPEDSWSGSSAGQPVPPSPHPDPGLIHLGTGERVLGEPPAAAVPPAPHQPIASPEIMRAAEMIGHARPETRSDDPPHGHGPNEPAPSTPASQVEIARTAEIITRVRPAEESSSEENGGTIHRVRVPVVLPRAALHRFQIVLDIEVSDAAAAGGFDGADSNEERPKRALTLE